MDMKDALIEVKQFSNDNNELDESLIGLLRTAAITVNVTKSIQSGKKVLQQTRELKQISDRLNVKGAKLSMIYKRLDPEKPAYTITGSGGGGTHVYHWNENRALTNRERARLQTFPDDFIFHGSKESVRRQIGMAVPVDGVRLILEAILKTFANVKYESIKPKSEVE